MEPGDYTVTVTDSDGCTGTSNNTLTGSATLIPLISAAPYACDGQLTLQAGTGFASYNWSNSETGTSITVDTSGNYFVTVTNTEGCSRTNSYTANIPALPSIAITGLDSIVRVAFRLEPATSISFMVITILLLNPSTLPEST